MTLPKLSKALLMRAVLLIILGVVLVSFLFQEEETPPAPLPPRPSATTAPLPTPSPTFLPTPLPTPLPTVLPTALPSAKITPTPADWRSIEETIKKAIVVLPTPTPLPKKVPPPPYRFLGRGLVYSCSRGHFACVDQASYLQCQAHQESMKFYKRPPLCVTENVYNSQTECEEAQQAKIDRSLVGENCNK